jgi:peptidoglycan/LPS O-acetylase OafA/YrhL
MQGHRPDIDGLRAVAIVPVVLFHAQVPAFSGGYVGVDVFFVISGFLITGIIRHEIDAGIFTIAGFYERRVRRLLPALFAMVLVTSAIGAWLLLPSDLVDFAASVLATVFFASNVLFWQQSGYFGHAAEQTPLLHTWSLAVEEQFYILYPLFLVFVATRWKRRYVPATVAVTAASFALGLVLVAADRDAAFYLAPGRAWELGIGALLAFGVLPPSRRAPVRNVTALLGAVAIGWSVFGYSESTRFPGTAALLPCLGTAALLWAGTGGRNVVGRVLSLRPLVLVGLVSYSLYLWHWPLLALGRYHAVRPLTPGETTVLLAVAVIASVVSWRYVERPFRGKRGLWRRRPLFLAALAAGGVFTAWAAVVLLAGGWPQRLEPEVARLVASALDRRPHDWSCSNVEPARIRAGDLCRLGERSTVEPTFLVWGDSHGRVLADPIGAAAARAGAAGWLAVHTGCAPLLGVRRSDRDDDCGEFNAATLDLLRRSPGITDVVLVGRWGLLAEGTRYGQESGRDAFLVEGDESAATPERNRPMFARALQRTVTRLVALDKRVWIVGSIPEVGWNVPSVLARSVRFGRPPPMPPTLTEFERRQRFVSATLSGLDALDGVTVVWPHAYLCDRTNCAVARDGRATYFDDHHLTLHGAAPLEPMFDEVFSP